MAQTGFTPIQLYFSSTTTNVPLAANLANGELAINITDGKLFYKDNAAAVQVIGWKTVPTSAGGTGLTSYTAGDTVYYATGTALSKLAIGANTTVMTSSGSAPQWTLQSALSVGTASNLLSNASTGVMQITGPGTGTTRVMTIPNANFTAARTDAGQTFTGNQVISAGTLDVSSSSAGVTIGDLYVDTPNKIVYVGRQSSTGGDASSFIVRGRQGTVAFQVDPGNPSITASADLTISGANLVIGTAAKGINFTANTPQAGKTSQLLNWYEEGTWTPNQGSGLVVVGTFSSTGTYTRIGRQVTAYISIVGSTSVALVGSNQPVTTNLPFSSSIAATGVLINSARSAFMGIQTAGTSIYCVGSVSATPDIEMTIVYTT